MSHERSNGASEEQAFLTRRDARDSSLYKEAESLHRLLRRPGTGLISDATEVSTNGAQVAFAGTLAQELKGSLTTRICIADLSNGDCRVVTHGPNTDRLPKYSPDGQRLAFLSDRVQSGNFQLHLLDLTSGAAIATPEVDGWVEYLHWSPDGARILLGVAGHGADIAGGQGAITSSQISEDLPSWSPLVESGEEHYRWRRTWLYELATGHVRSVGPADLNVWEASWCGDDSIAAVASPAPSEGLWYSARLWILDVTSDRSREVHVPHDQIGSIGSCPSGKYLAFVEAVCSDRGIIAGDLLITDTSTALTSRIDTEGVDISHVEWRSDRTLLLAGHRSFETVVGLYDVATKSYRQVWASDQVTTGGRYVSVAGLNEEGDCVVVAESYTQAPELGLIRGGVYRGVRSFDTGYAELARVIGKVEPMRWAAPDGLEIQGWLLRPTGDGPFPLVMSIHGGPVWHWRPTWLGRSGVFVLMLLSQGYAVFFPNPRGSTGRGRSFARMIVGDMGGKDTHDYLSALDYLVHEGIADPARLGVTGGSYGGFMTSWLLSQDTRFAAAVSVAPITNHTTGHLISNIPHFVSLYLADHYRNPNGKYFERSPVMHAHKVKTPTLNICGALDRCTPPEEAVQFHNALLENGVTSTLVTYPEEGHGVRKFPAAIDYAARVVAWFDRYMRSARPRIA